MKVIAFYLPQFHSIPENDAWWGEGFTEWVNVKNAKKYYEDQNQPRIPLNNFYYNLLDDEVKRWQIDIAKEHGIYGFCYYHYWFNGHMLLEKPLEQVLKNKSLDFPFCICWANENWTNTWVSDNAKTLISQRYGDKNEWREHFNYLLNFFKDDRYIKNNNKPLFVLYRPEIVKDLNKMLDYWDELAVEEGFDGIDFAYQHANIDYIPNSDTSKFKYNIETQPMYARIELDRESNTLFSAKHKFIRLVKKIGINPEVFKRKRVKQLDYDKTWKKILEFGPISEKSIPGAFVDFDNTPRRGLRGYYYKGANPDKFEYYFRKLVAKAKKEYKTDMIFVFAWNEWAEGGYLEPDETNGYGYLKAIKKVLEETKKE